MNEPQPGAFASTAAPRRRRGWVIVAILAVLLLAVFLRLHHAVRRGGHGALAASAAAVPVAVAAVARADVSVRLDALGAVTPLATVTVRTQISGQLQKIGFAEGQMVRAGQFLAQIDPRPYQAALEQAQASLDRDSAVLDNARMDLRRYLTLIARHAIAAQQLDTQRSLVKQYEGTVEFDRAQVRTAALNLQYAHIVAPVAGRVGLRQVDAGNYVTPADANGIVVITRLQPISVIFTLPEDDVDEVLGAMRGGPALALEAYDRTGRTRLATGRLLTMDNQIDPSTGTVKLRGEFDNRDGALFPNQFVNVRLLVGVLRDQLVIPLSAVQHGAPNGVPGTFVYVTGADHRAKVRTVSLGTTAGDRVVVASGLAAGELVVTEGADRLRDGAAVRWSGARSGAGGGKAQRGARRAGKG